MYWLPAHGATVSVPVGHSPDYDVIADWGAGHLERVQGKTSTFRERGRWAVRLATSGGNQSWNRIIKVLDSSRCDRVFIHVGDGRRWFIPAAAIEGRISIIVGGRKYSEFEVEPGDPLPMRMAAQNAARG